MGRALSVAAAAALLLPGTARAWSAHGHEVVATIAQDRLTTEARSAVASLLPPGVTLADIAPCADQVRVGNSKCDGLNLHPEPQSEPWHFIDIPITDTPSGGALTAYCQKGGKSDVCVTEQAKEDLQVLSDASASRQQKQVALMFLVHFIGDMHQPLHCAYESVDGVGDRGGNLKNVTLGPAQLNLHSLWDHMILPSDSADVGTLSAQLEKDIAGKDVSGWTAADSGSLIDSAAIESFSIAAGTIYPAYHDGGPDYWSAHQQELQTNVVYPRLEMAGVRLAYLLNQTLGRPSVAAMPIDKESVMQTIQKRARQLQDLFK